MGEDFLKDISAKNFAEKLASVYKVSDYHTNSEEEKYPILDSFYNAFESQCTDDEEKEKVKYLYHDIIRRLKLDYLKSNSLELNKQGNFANTINNYLLILENTKYADLLIYDEIKECLCFKDDKDIFTTHPLTDEDMSVMKKYIEDNFKLRSNDTLKDALNVFSRDKNHRINTIKARIESVKWDGNERIRSIFKDVLHSPLPEKYSAECGRLLFSHLINMIYNDEIMTDKYRIDEMIVLYGRQGQNKSTFCSYIALAPEYFNEKLNSIQDDKKIGESIQGKLVCELQELQCFDKEGEGTIKSFLSTKQYTYRSAYAVKPSDHQRHCVYIGTTNNDYCLPPDATGNRRFLPIPVISADIRGQDNGETTKAYILQCYAEALYKFKTNHPDMQHTHLNPFKDKELAMQIKQQQANTTPLLDDDEEVIAFLQNPVHQGERFNELTIRQICICALNVRKPSIEQKIRIDSLLNAYGWQRVKGRVADCRKWGQGARYIQVIE